MQRDPITFEKYLQSKGVVNAAKLHPNELALWQAAYKAEVPNDQQVPFVIGESRMEDVDLRIKASAILDEVVELKGVQCPAEFQIEASEASADGKKKLPTFSMTAYTGGPMHPGGWYRPEPIVVDIAGMEISSQTLPIDKGHGIEVGHSTSVEKTPGMTRVKLKGVLSGFHEDATHGPALAAREIVHMAGNGFPYQASIDAHISKLERFDDGEKVTVNGQSLKGPLYVARASSLRGVAILTGAADKNTQTTIAAQLGSGENMNPEFLAWLKANEYTDAEAAALTGKKLTTLQAAWQATKVPPPPHPEPAKKETSVAPDQTFDAKMAAIEAENQRITYIRERTTAAAEKYIGDSEKLRDLRELCDSAIADKKIDARAFDLALLRLDRALAPSVFAPSKQMINEDVLTAAVCVAHKLPGVEEKFEDRILQAAHTKFKRGISLRDLLILAAERNNNYRGSSRDDVALCRAAFGIGIHAEGPSTMSLPNIFSTVANSFLASGFFYTERAWREIARIKTANDFRQMSTYRLTGNNKFKLVPPGGEIKHGTLSELTYTNVIDTYGIMIGLDRRDVRNDSLDALTQIPQELGRGAGDSLNEIFWTEFLDDAAFFPTDGSLGNYDAGAVDSVLSLAGLANADSIFSLLTKPDGSPLGAMPQILLAPRTLRATAMNLMNGQFLTSALTTPTGTTTNIWADMFKIVSSVYLSSSAIAGSSATAWYLMADPQNLAAIEVAFLDGVESPTVETSQFDFDRLGIAMRAYLDFGVSKMEPRAAVKLKGAA